MATKFQSKNKNLKVSPSPYPFATEILLPYITMTRVYLVSILVNTLVPTKTTLVHVVIEFQLQGTKEKNWKLNIMIEIMVTQI